MRAPHTKVARWRRRANSCFFHESVSALNPYRLSAILTESEKSDETATPGFLTRRRLWNRYAHFVAALGSNMRRVPVSSPSDADVGYQRPWQRRVRYTDCGRGEP